MNMLSFDVETQISLLHGVSSTVSFATNWLMQSTILISFGLIVARLLRRQGAAVQSLVYRITLIAVLACPLATLVLWTGGVTGWSVKMPKVWEVEGAQPVNLGSESLRAESVDFNPQVEPVMDEPNRLESTPLEMEVENSIASDQQFNDLVDEPEFEAKASKISIEESTAALANGNEGESPKLSIHRFGIVALLLSFVWLLIASILLLRLVSAFWKLGRVRRIAIPVQEELRTICHRLSNQMQVTPPRILRSPFLPSPCLTGIWDPAILLPEEDSELSMQDLLVHELAHLRRRDCGWNLLRQVATSLLFFQPLLWLLSRRVEVSAEEVCDDYVVQFGGDRTDYANSLVDIAELSSNHVAAAGVGVVSMRSMLSQRVIRIMDTSRNLSTNAGRMLMLSALGCGLLGTTITGMVGLGSGRTTNVVSEADPSTTNEADKVETNRRFVGSVVDPNGQPASHAKLYMVFYASQDTGLLDPSWQPVATADDSGKFDFTVNDSAANYREFKHGTLVAVKDGFGFAWESSSLFDPTGKSQEHMRERLKTTAQEYRPQLERQLARVGQPLRLSKDDQAISGRIVNIEGRPVVGAKLTLLSVATSENDDLSDWREEAVKSEADYYSARTKTARMMNGPQVRSLVKQATTDQQGKFRMPGIGNGRIAELLVEGPGIASEKIFARTEPGAEIQLKQSKRSPDLGDYTYYANEFAYIAGPSTAITGIVRDQETKSPLAGVTIKSQSRHGEAISGWGQDFVRAVTDAKGRFVLNGMPIGEDNRIAAIPPLNETAYLPASRRAQTFSPDEPLDLELELPRGVWVAGRVTDKSSGRGLSGWLHYYGHQDNQAAQGSMHVDRREQMVADQEGNFKIAVSPGRGFVTFMAHAHQQYPRARSIIKQDGTRQEVTQRGFAQGTSMIPINSHAIIEINPERREEVVDLNIELDRGNTLMARVVGPDATPVSDFYYTGRVAALNDSWNRSKGGKLELVNYDEAFGRQIYLLSKDRTLAGSVFVHGKQSEEIVIKLQPAGVAKGRLIDSDGVPIAKCRLINWRPMFSSPREATSKFDAPPLPQNQTHSLSSFYQTDAQGNFEISGLVAGVEYRVLAMQDARMADAARQSGPLKKFITVKPGEKVELGDVQIGDQEKMMKEFKERNKTAAPLTNPLSKADIDVISGTVVSHTRKPIVGAKLYWMRSRAYELESTPPRLIATTDAKGKFKFKTPPLGLPKDAPARWDYYQWIVVRAPGHGFVTTQPGALIRDMQRASNSSGQFANSLAGVEGAVIGLPPAGNPLRGRILDIDGQPVAGAAVRIKWFQDHHTDEQWVKQVDSLHQIIEPAPAIEAFPMAKTNKDGKFEIKDIGPNRLFRLLVQGDNIETTMIIARNHPGEKIKVDSTFYQQPKHYEVFPQDILQVVGPSNPVTGSVVDVDTGQPIKNALVRATIRNGVNRILSREQFNSRTDENGRYRITGLPVGDGNRLVCICSDVDRPYPVLGIKADTSNADTSHDFKMKQGVWVQGRVFDSDTNQPMTGSVSYYYLRNAELEREHPGVKLAQMPRYNWTSSDGHFRIPVWPVRGILAYQHDPATHEEAMQRPIDRYPRGAGAESIAGQEKNMQAFPTFPVYLMIENYRRLVEINPDAGEQEITADMPMSASRSVVVRPVWPTTVNVNEYQVYGANPNWGWERKTGAEVEIRGLKAGERRKVFIFHRESNQVGNIIVSADSDKDSVKIDNFRPAGVITGRFVDDDGEPVTDATLSWDYRVAADPDSGVWAPHPGKRMNPSRIPTDQNGEFRLTGVVPGLNYTALATAMRKMYSNRMVSTGLGKLFSNVKVEPGETKELGEIRIGGQGAGNDAE